MVYLDGGVMIDICIAILWTCAAVGTVISISSMVCWLREILTHKQESSE